MGSGNKQNGRPVGEEGRVGMRGCGHAEVVILKGNCNGIFCCCCCLHF